MERIFNRPPIRLNSIFKFDHLEKEVQSHLKNVYATLSIGILAATLGAYIHVASIFTSGLISFISTFGLFFAIIFTESSRENINKRLGFFVGFGFFSGMNLGPLIEYVGMINPTILPTALLSTSLIFFSFTLSALFNKSRTYLYLGGSLLSALNILFFMSFLNIFIGSKMMMSAELYIGLGLFSLFILFDTQLIIFKKQNGDSDFIWHALDLFIDVIAIFRRIMILLSKKEERESNKNE